MGTTPAPWFTSVIVSGLQRLAAMRLPSTPLDGDLRLAAAVWIAALWARREWEAERDAPRLEAPSWPWPAWPAAGRRPPNSSTHLPPKPIPRALPAPRARAGLRHLTAIKHLLGDLQP